MADAAILRHSLFASHADTRHAMPRHADAADAYFHLRHYADAYAA